MGVRGCGWRLTALHSLAQVWVATSENAVTGIDQTSERFRTALLVECNSLYQHRDAKGLRSHFDEMARDVQKFRKSIRTIFGFCPTGVDEDNMFCMALDLHLKKPKPTSPDRKENDMYNFKDFDTSKWRYYVACKTWQKTRKFCLDMGNHVPVATNHAKNLPVIAEVPEGDQDHDEYIIDEPLRRTTTRSSAGRGGHSGTKAEKIGLSRPYD